MNMGKRSQAHAKSATNASTSLMSVLDAVRLGWAAGFLDGEGCIHIARQRYRSERSATYRLGVYVTQNDRQALEYFREVVGIEAPIHEVKRAKNHRRQCYTLNFSGHGAMELIAKLCPHLQRKRPEAEAALEFWARGRTCGRSVGKGLNPEITAIREHYFELLKRLK